MKLIDKIRNKLICWLVGKKPVILNVAVGLPDKDTAATVEPVLSPYGKNKQKQKMLIKNVLVYKPVNPDPAPGEGKKRMLTYEIDYYESTNSVGVDPQWL
jgi:hypothetical protein